MPSRRVAGAVVVACLAWSGAARALDGEVTSDTAAQFYDVRSPTGETVLTRRRLTTTLGVAGYDILEQPYADPHAPQLLFRARMRYDADYGASGAETDVTNYGRLVPGFQRGPIDLMYGYVEGRRLLNGWLGFKLGRQYVIDGLGWYAFDGGEVKVTTPYFFALEGYGGLEVRSGLPLSSSRWGADGVWRGDRTGYDPSLYPSFQPSDVAPVVGAALESTGVTWLHGRLTYRRVINTGDVATSQFASGLTFPAAYTGARISQEKLGYALDGAIGSFGNASASLIYDLYLARFTSLRAGVDAFLTKQLNVGLDYEYYQPSFDGDSIWNFFLSMPMNDVGLRASYMVDDHVTIAGDAHARIYSVQTSEDVAVPSTNYDPQRTYFPTNGHPFDEGADLSARYKFGEGSLGARASGNFGDAGDRVGGDVMGERVLETRYVLSGRANVWQWKDKLRPDRDATSVGYVAGVGYLMAPRARVMFEFQHDMNRLVGQRLRGMIWLTLAVTK